MSRPNPYINILYLAVHFALNMLVILLAADLIDTYFPVKHLFVGYEVSLRNYYEHMNVQKNLPFIIVIGAAAAWYYQRRKTHNQELKNREQDEQLPGGLL